ncbi:hypothetical protein [Oxalicibacterium solurbis]|nr:hypothetical protein [Oxalicibacterium solurbis]
MMKRMPKRVSNSIQRGSVLLESLIAILIFSLGILSLVGLLGASVKDTASSMYRTQASLLASEVIGEMWAKSQTTTNVPTLLAGYKGSGPEAWREKVAAALPGVVEGAGEDDTGSNLPVIDVDGDTVTVTIYWKAPGDTSAHQYVIATRIVGNTNS